MEQLGPASGGHGGPGGELVAGGHITDRRAGAGQRLDGQAVRIHGQAAAGDAVVLQHPPGAGVAGVLHRRRARQQRGQQTQQIFQTRPHDDLLRPAPHAPVFFQIIRQRLPQLDVPLRVAVGQQFGRGVEQLLLEPCPGAEREEGRVHPPRGEVIPHRLHRRSRLRLGQERGGRRRGRADGQGQIFLYIKAAALPRFQISFRREQLISCIHGVHRDGQFRRQPPLAGHPGARRDGPGAHLLGQALIELFVQRHRRGCIQCCRQMEHKTPPLFGHSLKLTP